KAGSGAPGWHSTRPRETTPRGAAETTAHGNDREAACPSSPRKCPELSGGARAAASDRLAVYHGGGTNAEKTPSPQGALKARTRMAGPRYDTSVPLTQVPSPRGCDGNESCHNHSGHRDRRPSPTAQQG